MCFLKKTGTVNSRATWRKAVIPFYESATWRLRNQTPVRDLNQLHLCKENITRWNQSRRFLMSVRP